MAPRVPSRGAVRISQQLRQPGAPAEDRSVNVGRIQPPLTRSCSLAVPLWPGSPWRHGANGPGPRNHVMVAAMSTLGRACCGSHARVVVFAGGRWCVSGRRCAGAAAAPRPDGLRVPPGTRDGTPGGGRLPGGQQGGRAVTGAACEVHVPAAEDRATLSSRDMRQSPIPGVTAHDNPVSYEGTRNAGKMSLRRRM